MTEPETPVTEPEALAQRGARKQPTAAQRKAAARRRAALKPTLIDRLASDTVLRNYRIMAWIVGVPLAVLILVAVPIKYIGGNGTPVGIIGIAHGWLYVIFIVMAVMLSVKRKWNVKRTAIVILCGTIPLLSFYTEHVVHKHVKAEDPGW